MANQTTRPADKPDHVADALDALMAQAQAQADAARRQSDFTREVIRQNGEQAARTQASLNAVNKDLATLTGAQDRELAHIYGIHGSIAFLECWALASTLALAIVTWMTYRKIRQLQIRLAYITNEVWDHRQELNRHAGSPQGDKAS